MHVASQNWEKSGNLLMARPSSGRCLVAVAIPLVIVPVTREQIRIGGAGQSDSTRSWNSTGFTERPRQGAQERSLVGQQVHDGRAANAVYFMSSPMRIMGV